MRLNDLEYHRGTPLYYGDLYLELRMIEERGLRLREARRKRLAAIFHIGSRRPSIGAARTA